MNTVFEVMYRDGHNYKRCADWVFAGAATPQQMASVTAHLDNGIYFVPMQLGLEHLAVDTEWSFPTEIDHPWHELVGIEVTDRTPNMTQTVDEFVELFCSTEWDDVTAWKEIVGEPADPAVPEAGCSADE